MEELLMIFDSEGKALFKNRATYGICHILKRSADDPLTENRIVQMINKGMSGSGWKKRFYLNVLSRKINDFENEKLENYYELYLNVLDCSVLPYWMETDVMYLFSTTKTDYTMKNLPFADCINFRLVDYFEFL